MIKNIGIIKGEQIMNQKQISFCKDISPGEVMTIEIVKLGVS